MRGATASEAAKPKTKGFLLTHLMRGATQLNGENANELRVSTHAPHARCDQVGDRQVGDRQVVSTHAPHARCDLTEEKIC